MKKTPKLYVANGTMQNMTICYRCPNTNQVRYKQLANRRQICIDDGYTIDQVNQIIRHLERFGAREADDIKALENPFGLLFFVDKPIESGAIDEALGRNKDIIQDVAAEEAEKAGVAAFKAASHFADSEVHETELEVVQLDTNGRPMGQSDLKGKVDFSVAVSKRTQGRQEGRRRSA